MSLAVFIHCSESKQVSELKKFLKAHGAKISDNTDIRDDNWWDDYRSCIEHLNICWTYDSITESEVNDVLTTVASLFIQVPLEHQDYIICALRDQFIDFSGDNSRKHKSKLFSLNLIFHGLHTENHNKCDVYLALLTCARKLGVTCQIITDPKKVMSWLSKCRCSNEKCQEVWKKLYEVHAELGENRRATEALVYLLSTYTEATAAQARQDAIKCIISVMQDPSLLAHDQLYGLRPVQCLEGEIIHDFFKIFVSGNLSTFKNFLSTHPGFLSQYELDEDACVHKLKLLTLMQLSENQSKLSYEDAARELELPVEKLEPFIIEAVRQRAVACKLDQVNRNILITGAFPRTFGRTQWANLYDTLKQWHSGLTTIQTSIGGMIEAESV